MRIESHSQTDFKIARYWDLGAQPMWGEKPKTHQQIDQIEVIRDILRRYLMDTLGMTGDILPLDRIHLLNPEVYHHPTHGLGNSSAKYFPGSHSMAVCIDSSVGNTLSGIAEELIHGSSNHPHQYNTALSNYSAREVGYDYRVRKHLFFGGLTEGVTSILRTEMISANLPWLIKEFQLSSTEQQNLLNPHYAYCRSRVGEMVRYLGQTSGSREIDIHLRLQREMYTEGFEPYHWLRKELGDQTFEGLAYLEEP